MGMTNTINLDALQQTKEALTNNPEAGVSTKVANIHWQSGLQHRITIGDYQFQTDMPEHIGGTATQSGPGGYLFGAIGSCLATTFEMIASQQNITLESVDITIEGTINPAVFLGVTEGYAGYTDLIARLNVTSDASQETIQTIGEEAANRSPVVASLATNLKVVTE